VLVAARAREFNPSMITFELREPWLLYHHTVDDLQVAPDDLRQATDEWLEWYADECREAGIRPWILYYPVAPLVISGPWGTAEDAEYTDAPDIRGDRSIVRLLGELAAQHGIGVIDATETLLAHADEKLYHRWDTHPTARAHELVAAEAARVLEPVIREAAGRAN